MRPNAQFPCDVTILVCTRNKADDLKETLASIGSCEVPETWRVEAIVIDNGSTDRTAEIVAQAEDFEFPLTYLREEELGQCRARNLGLRASQGRVLLFTDDDVRVPKDWVTRMCKPILAGQADGVAGSVKIAPHLQRKWMEPSHIRCFAWDFSRRDRPGGMVGASMAFSRRVLDRVPAFDEQLGPGQLGFSDDVLFSWQLNAAGYSIISAGDCYVEHHFDASRLTRPAFLLRSRQEGRVAAYLSHHWSHHRMKWPYGKAILQRVQLAVTRLVRRRAEGSPCPSWEMALITKVEHKLFLHRLRKVPRRYNRHGLQPGSE